MIAIIKKIEIKYVWFNGGNGTMDIVVSEVLRDATGKPIGQSGEHSTGRAAQFGGVSFYLADLITQKMGYRARAEKPGLLGRASIALQSEVDVKEAILVGVEAVQAITQG